EAPLHPGIDGEALTRGGCFDGSAPFAGVPHLQVAMARNRPNPLDFSRPLWPNHLCSSAVGGQGCPTDLKGG
ncbi:MAG: hypothetical protein WAN65_22855, partial [Candidatus Sulfotelmatobacter sp.]